MSSPDIGPSKTKKRTTAAAAAAAAAKMAASKQHSAAKVEALKEKKAPELPKRTRSEPFNLNQLVS
jgi:hypothetical protein